MKKIISIIVSTIIFKATEVQALIVIVNASGFADHELLLQILYGFLIFLVFVLVLILFYIRTGKPKFLDIFFK